MGFVLILIKLPNVGKFDQSRFEKSHSVSKIKKFKKSDKMHLDFSSTLYTAKVTHFLLKFEQVKSMQCLLYPELGGGCDFIQPKQKHIFCVCLYSASVNPDQVHQTLIISC